MKFFRLYGGADGQSHFEPLASDAKSAFFNTTQPATGLLLRNDFAPHINTFLVYVPSIVVPAGFTRDQLPTGITFLGRPYDDGNMIKLAYAYEQATRHRKPPASVTPL